MARRRVTEILEAVWTSRPDGSGLPDALVELCSRSLPVSGAGMSLMTEDGPAGTVAATDGPARELEELQFALGEGPCVDASRTGRPVLQPDLARTAPARWPAFADGASAAGLGAVFALPLRVGAIRLGVLDLYRDTVGRPLPGRAGRGPGLRRRGDRPAAAPAGPGRRHGPAAGSLNVLDDRAEVHQATGAVCVQAGVSLADALVLLRARAYTEQRLIRELARDVLDGLVHFRSELDD